MPVVYENQMKIADYLFLFVCAAALVFCLAAPPCHARDKDPAPADAGANTWTLRCEGEEGDPARKCEIFQRLIAPESGERVAEFAIGFPQGKTDARGVIVLPLGILVSDPVEMAIDENPAFQFRVRYCATQGCVAVVNINPELLAMFKKGRQARIVGKTYRGQPVAITMSLTGFTRAIERL